MALTRNEFNNALRMAVSAEFSHITSNEESIDYRFSEHFEKKMEKLMRSQKKPYYRLFNTAAKRVAMVGIVFMLLFGTAFSVKAIREPIIDFIVDIHDTFVRFLFEGDTTNKIAKEFKITEIPDGFRQTGYEQNEGRILSFYKNNTGIEFRFFQIITDGTMSDVDNEHTLLEKRFIRGVEVYVYSFHEEIQAMWIEDGYMLMLICDEEIDMETIIGIIETIQ